jgi:hypothetical protein
MGGLPRMLSRWRVYLSMSQFAFDRLLRIQLLIPVLRDPKRPQKGYTLVNLTLPTGDLLRTLFGNVTRPDGCR